MKGNIVTYRFLVKPSTAQCKRIDRWIGTCRYVYNLAKETKEYAYSKGISYSKYDLIKMLPALKEKQWIKDVDSQALQAVIERLDNSYQKFFQGGGFPRWARKDRYNSFLCKKGKVVNDGVLNIPKIGNLKFKNTRGIDSSAKIKTVTIKKEGNKYFACVTLERYFEPLEKNNNQIGIDLGVSHFATSSDGEYFDTPNLYKQYKSEMNRIQRQLARRKKFGSNWKKTKNKLNKLHTKIANIRKDFQHKISTRIINENQVIVIEDLKIRNMTRSAKGNEEQHGKNVKAKSGLNRSILDKGLSSFVIMLEYKAMWYGRDLEKVDPKYTSQGCNACGHTDKANRQSQSKFLCTWCGHTDNADVNAANNILAKGIRYILERKAVA